MTQRTLAESLAAYADSDCYPFHMPGHKRRLTEMLPDFPEALQRAARLDITEIDGFDNLHDPEGILKDAEEKAAALYGADSCYYSVNGSTAGLLTAISAAVPEGGKLILARNCHKAVYHSIYLRRLTPVYLYPDIVPGTSLAGTLTKEQIEAALIQNPDASAVLLTSPTYDGITADIASIAETVHRFGKTLIVDAAHGAHFGFHPGFPKSPVALGADLTIVSLHKTMPCLTQTALLLQKGSRVSTQRLRLFEGIYQTSSPSYLMMAAMDSCMDMVKKHGAGLWDSFFTERERFLECCSSLKRLQVLTDGTKWSRKMTSETGFLMDSGKILSETSKTCLTGKRFYDILLKQYHLQMEMAAGNYVTAIMTCCDTADGWQRLWDALKEIDDFCVAADEPVQENRKLLAYPVLKQQISLTEALDAPKAQVPLTEAVGQTAGAFINLYPPGIPIVAPGEQITQEAVDVITRYRQMNLPVQGVDHDAITILKLC